MTVHVAKDEHEMRRERLKELRRRLYGGVNAAFAKDAGLDPSTLHRVLTGETHTVSDKVLQAVLQNVQDEQGRYVSREWLEEGEGEAFEPADSRESTGRSRAVDEDVPAAFERSEERSVQVPHFGPVGAGPGTVPLEVERHVEMTQEEYRLLFGGRDREDVGLFKVIGDSAAPEYFSDEDVPVEVHKRGPHQFQQDTKYIFRWDEHLMLKRLREEENSRIRAESLNPGIDPFYFSPRGEHDFAVIARVLESPKQQLYSSLVGRFLRRAKSGNLLGE